MIRPLALIGLVWLTVALAPAQSLDAYLRLRREHGIKGAMSVDDVESLVGIHVVELKAVVKGTFKVGDAQTLIVDHGDGDAIMIDAGNSVPDWVSTGEIPARLVIRVDRPGLNSQLSASLLGMVTEAQMAPIERQEEEAEAARAAKARSERRAPTASRGSYSRTPMEWSTPANDALPIYSSFIRRWNPRLSAAESDQIATCVIGFSLRKGIDPRLIMAIVMTESDFNPSCTSSAGAMGLGQLMPSDLDELGLNNAYDNVQNLYGTATQIRKKLDKYRQMTTNDYDALVLTLAGYNAGDGAVKKYGGVPPYRETQNYVRKVIGYYQALTGYRLSR
jgi:soluble lytic murein transglycosylase-like protein